MSKGLLKDISALKPGDHCLFIHEGREEKDSLLSSYFRTGLERGERCLALLDDPSMESFCKSLSGAGVDIAEEKRRGRLILQNSWQTYLDGSGFDPERMICLWKKVLKEAEDGGYRALRAAGDLNWAFGDSKNIEKLLDYERGVKQVFDASPVLAICLYERSLLNKELLLEIVNSHPYLIQGGMVRKNSLFETHPGILGQISKKYGEGDLKKSFLDYDDLARNKKSLDDFYSGIMDIIPAVLYRLSDGSVEFISSHIKDLTGHSAEEFYSGRADLKKMIHPEDSELLKENLISRKPEAISSFYYRIIRKEGEIAWVHDISRTFQRDGKVFSDGVLIDVTEMKFAEEALRASEENFKALADNANDGILMTVDGKRHVYANSRASAITGYSKDELLEIGIKDLAHPDTVSLLSERFRKRLAGEELPNQYETVIVRKDGKGVPLEITAAKTHWHGKPAIMAVFRDVSERKKAEEELLKKTEELKGLNSELHRLAIELSNLEENERKQFAEVLHEGIGQNLVALKMSLEGFAKGKRGEKDMKAMAEQMLLLLDESIRSTRAMTADLYPAPMKDMGLCGAVRWYVRTVAPPKEKKVSFEVDEALERELSGYNRKEINRAAFHIIREALQNSMKYSSASDIRIRCSKEDGLIMIEVSDNGVGFDHGELRTHPGRGLGLMLMREWAAAANGGLSIKSAPGKGTEVRAEFPVEGRKK